MILTAGHCPAVLLYITLLICCICQLKWLPNDDSILTKARKDVGIKFMKSWERERELKEEGRAEGREEGREEGRAEGLTEGLEKGARIILDQLVSEGIITTEKADKIRESLSVS